MVDTLWPNIGHAFIKLLNVWKNLRTLVNKSVCVCSGQNDYIAKIRQDIGEEEKLTNFLLYHPLWTLEAHIK